MECCIQVIKKKEHMMGITYAGDDKENDESVDHRNDGRRQG
jgi:hypothetical protein